MPHQVRHRQPAHPEATSPAVIAVIKGPVTSRFTYTPPRLASHHSSMTFSPSGTNRRMQAVRSHHFSAKSRRWRNGTYHVCLRMEQGRNSSGSPVT